MFRRFPTALLAFVAINLAIAAQPVAPPPVLSASNFSLTEKIKQEGKPSSWWLAHAYTTGDTPQIVVCGSSQIGGLQSSDANLTGLPVDFVSNHHCPSIERSLSARGIPDTYVFLSALPGAMMSDHFAIARALYREHTPPLVVLTVSPRDFIDNSLPCAGSTEPYRFFSTYSDMSAYTALAYNRPWSRLEYFVSREMPLMRLRQSLADISGAASAKTESVGSTAATATDAGTKIADQVKFVMGGYEGNIRPGQAVLTPNLPRIYVDNTRDYKRRYKNTHPDTYDVQMRYFRQCVAYLTERGSRVMVVGMPLTASNRALLPADFWRRYRGDIKDILAESKSRFVDLIADESFTIDDFCDTVHLNAAGGKRLAEAIAKNVEEICAGDNDLSASLSKSYSKSELSGVGTWR